MYFVEKTKGMNFTKQFDYILFIAVLILSIAGMFILNSATHTMSNGSRLMTIQAICLVIGIVLSLLISSLDYKDFKVLGIIFYIISIFLLVLVLFIGTGEKQWGSRSWIRFGGIGFQPAEFAKITFVIVLSIFMERISEGNQKNKNIVKMLIYAAIPIALILLQPDTGTALVFLFIFAVMIFMCGFPYKYILISFGTFLVSLPFIWFFALKPYQKNRILVFFFPEMDPQGSAYHVIQSKRAIGSGQIYGKGLYEGIQTQNGIVPEKHTDFIFTVIGEELGLIGSIAVVLIIFFILLRCLYIARNSRDTYGAFLVVGLSSMLAFHFIENIGMTIGLTPVTGIPLPFISQGGTSLIANFVAIGVMLSVSMRRKKTIFNTSQ